MRLLIIGGTGQLSGRVTAQALAAGHEVWVLNRGSKPVPEGVHALTADRQDGAAVQAALACAGVTWDAVLDCICMNAAHARQDLTLLTGYTSRLIVVSTDSVYHPAHKTVPQDENAPAYMADGGYGAHKRQMEEAFLAADTPIRWTLFRPGHIFGEGFLPGCFPEQSRQRTLLDHMRGDKPLRLVGGGQYLIHPIYVDDLARVMLEAICNPATQNEIFCIGGPDVVTNAAYYRILGRILGHEAVIEAIPEEGYLDAHPECSGHLCHRAYSLEKLRRTGIPLPDTTLEEGLRRQVDWLDANA